MFRRSHCAIRLSDARLVLSLLLLSIGVASPFTAHALTTYEGGEFRVDGVLVPGLENPGTMVELTPTKGQFVTGTLSDGSIIGFTSAGSGMPRSTVQFVARALPYQPATIHLPGDPVPPGLREGRTLIVANDAIVPDNFGIGWNSAVSMTGGQIGSDLIAVHSSIDISGGAIGDRFHAIQGSRVSLHGGHIGQHARISGGSHLEINGGTVGQSILLTDGSTATIRDGTVGTGFHVMSGSRAEIIGGQLGHLQVVQTWQTSFTINGMETFPDNDPVAHANIHGGQFAGGLRVDGGTANVFVGNFNGPLTVVNRAIANVYDATFGFSVVSDNGILNIHGGEFKGMKVLGQHSGNIHMNPTGTVHVYGGTFTDSLSVGTRGFLHIYGGSFHRIIPQGLSETTIYGTDFALDVAPGEPGSNLMELLTPNTPYLLDIRQTTLSATLSDGSPFELGLFTSSPGQNMSPYAKIYLVLVQIPEPGTASLALLVLVGLVATRRWTPYRVARLFGHPCATIAPSCHEIARHLFSSPEEAD